MSHFTEDEVAAIEALIEVFGGDVELIQPEECGCHWCLEEIEHTKKKKEKAA